MNKHPEASCSEGSPRLHRRSVLSAPLAIAAPGIALPMMDRVAAKGADHARAPSLAPRRYRLRRHWAHVDLRSKLAVVTGASRGIGRAVGEALAAIGVDVIGTSRDPATVPAPPAFLLLRLDIADAASAHVFVGALGDQLAFASRGRLDILINDAGHFVIGRIVPPPHA